jgi:hypothetical protein
LSDGTRIGYAHASASAFNILASRTVVWIPRATHTQIFAALRIVTDPGSSPYSLQAAKMKHQGPGAIYRDYGLCFYPTAPGDDEIAWFNANWTGDLGAMRQCTLSGHVWQDVLIDGR